MNLQFEAGTTNLSSGQEAECLKMESDTEQDAREEPRGGNFPSESSFHS